MKKTLFFVLLGLVTLCMLDACNKKPDRKAHQETTDTSVDKLLKDYANAVDSFATVAALISGDDAAYAVADSVHQMHKQLLDSNFTRERMFADIYQMQSFIGYEWGCVPASLAQTYKQENVKQLSALVLDEIMPMSKDLYRRMAETEFKSVKLLMAMGLQSCMHIQARSLLVQYLNGANDAEVFDNAGMFYVQSIHDLDSLDRTGNYPAKQLYRIAYIMEESMFYMTITPMIFSYAPESITPDDPELKQVKAIGDFNDGAMQNITDCLENNKPIAPISDGDFEVFLKKSLANRVKLLHMLNRNVITNQPQSDLSELAGQ